MWSPQLNMPGTFKMKKKQLKCTFCHYTGHTYNKCQWRLGIGAATTDQECHVVLPTHKNNIRGRTIDEGHNWYLNLGVTAHMTSHREWLHDFINIEPHKIVLSDNSILHTTGRGMIHAQQTSESGDPFRVELMNVLYVPHLAKNLMSTAVITDAGLKAIIHACGCTIMEPCTHQLCLLTIQQGHMLLIPMELHLLHEQAQTISNNKLTLDQLHHHYRHINKHQLHLLLSKQGCSFQGTHLLQCTTCIT
jgi:hypothetical protein